MSDWYCFAFLYGEVSVSTLEIITNTTSATASTTTTTRSTQMVTKARCFVVWQAGRPQCSGQLGVIRMDAVITILVTGTHNSSALHWYSLCMCNCSVVQHCIRDLYIQWQESCLQHDPPLLVAKHQKYVLVCTMDDYE